MPDELVNKASAWGGAISVWLKIGGTIMAIVGYGFLTYYQIQSNSHGLDELKIVIKDNNEAIEREFEIWGTRSDKRYKRAMETAKELKQANKELELELEDTKLDIAFIKGRMYEQDKNR